MAKTELLHRAKVRTTCTQLPVLKTGGLKNKHSQLPELHVALAPFTSSLSYTLTQLHELGQSDTHQLPKPRGKDTSTPRATGYFFVSLSCF